MPPLFLAVQKLVHTALLFWAAGVIVGLLVVCGVSWWLWASGRLR